MTQTLERNVLEALLSPEGIQNPYPIYDRLRETAPVFWNPAMQIWMLTRYHDIMTALNDSRFSSDWTSTFRFLRPLDEEEQPIFERLLEFFSLWMQASDAPKHQSIRAPIQKAFTPKMMLKLQTQVNEVVANCLAKVRAKGYMEVYADLALPLPSVVICQMLGVPEEYNDQFVTLSHSISSFIGIGIPAPGQLAQIENDVEMIRRMLKPVIDEKRKNPANDLISTLVQSENIGEGLTAEEIVSNAVFLLFAGHDTTTNLICNGTLALLQNPDQLAKLKAQPELIRNALEELLRYDASTQWIPRVLKEDVAIGGKLLQKGQYVGMWLGAANYDPAVFENPHKLDITRTARNLSFGYGPHYCLGVALARMEGQAAISSLIQLPDLELAGEAVRNPNFTIRGLRSLPVKFKVS
jgi:pimeloyl-[acyl-carrier protein] synthase